MTEKQAKEVQKRLAKHNPFVRLTASNLAGKRVAINTTEDLCIIGVVDTETSTTLVIDGRHYFKGGIDAIYEITSENLLES